MGAMGANGRLVHVEVRGEGEEIGVVGVDGQERHQYHGQHTFPSYGAFHVCPLQKLQASGEISGSVDTLYSYPLKSLSLSLFLFLSM